MTVHLACGHTFENPLHQNLGKVARCKPCGQFFAVVKVTL